MATKKAAKRGTVAKKAPAKKAAPRKAAKATKKANATERNKANASARSRAVSKLVDRHRDEFAELFAAERTRLGIPGKPRVYKRKGTNNK